MTNGPMTMALNDQIGRPVLGNLSEPVLLPVIHAEEEFPWHKPFDRNKRGTAHVEALESVQYLFEKYDLKPLYLLSDPVARDTTAQQQLASWLEAGNANIGAHLHPWVVEPYLEKLGSVNSYPGNLPIELEIAKLTRLTDTIEDIFAVRPTAYLAGRYGLGASTANTLEGLGYRIDLSPSPTYDFTGQDGPNYQTWPSHAFFNRSAPQLLHIPHACGYAGALAHGGRPAGLGKLLPLHITARLKLLQHGRISPEGMPLSFLKALTKDLVAGGASVITFSFHSPSLMTGFTPYVQSIADLEAFLDTIDRFCRWFTQDFGGLGMDVDTLYTRAVQEREAGM